MDNKSNLQEILDNVDMIDVMQGYIDLERKKDDQYVALCPFHEDRNPSFSVNPIKGVYHCFGCGASGNLITFLEQINNESYIDSVRRLSKITGIEYNQRKMTAAEKKLKIRHDLINQMQDIMQHSLFSKKFKDVLNVIKERGLSEEQIKSFGLGYCDKKTIKNYFEANDISLDQQIQTELVDLQNDTVRYPIEGRITFPIKNINGQIVGFSGGRIDKDTIPKYKHSIHTDEGPGFFYQDSYSITNSKITVVEGFYDQISLSISGIKNVVSTLGTTAGASDDKVKELLTKSNDFVICMDGDIPGLESASKMARMLKEKNQFNDSKVSLVFVPDDLDPDDYRRKYGTDRLKKVYDKKLNEAEFRSKLAIKKFKKDPTSKEDLIKSIVINLKYTDDDLQKELFLKKVSKQFHISTKALLDFYDKWNNEREQQEDRQSVNNQSPNNEKDDEQSTDIDDVFDQLDSIESELDTFSIEPEDQSLNIQEQALLSYVIHHPNKLDDIEDPELVFHHRYALNSLYILKKYYGKYHKIDVDNINKRLKNDFAVEQIFIKKSSSLSVSNQEFNDIIDSLSMTGDDKIRKEALLKDLESDINSDNKYNIDDYLNQFREGEDVK